MKCLRGANSIGLILAHGSGESQAGMACTAAGRMFSLVGSRRHRARGGTSLLASPLTHPPWFDHRGSTVTTSPSCIQFPKTIHLRFWCAAGLTHTSKHLLQPQSPQKASSQLWAFLACSSSTEKSLGLLACKNDLMDYNFSFQCRV